MTDSSGYQVRRHEWRSWLRVFLGTYAALSLSLYGAVVIIDPFSTGRFTPIKRVDAASATTPLARAGLVRDSNFDGAIFGNSIARLLDPAAISKASGWRIAQFSISAAFPGHQLTVARAFERHHAAVPTLEIYILDALWCRNAEPNEGQWGPFPDWLYESTDREYLTRMLFPGAVLTAATRAGILLGIVRPRIRADGFSPEDMRNNRDQLLKQQRPTADVPPEAPFPAIDALHDHLTTLPSRSAVALVFPPFYINTLPVEGSSADARLRACKERIQRLAGRPRAVYLDLMIDNPITRNLEFFFDELHYTPAAARIIEAEIAGSLERSGISR